VHRRVEEAEASVRDGRLVARWRRVVPTLVKDDCVMSDATRRGETQQPRASAARQDWGVRRSAAHCAAEAWARTIAGRDAAQRERHVGAREDRPARAQMEEAAAANAPTRQGATEHACKMWHGVMVVRCVRW
jgi:hypothetical protein